MRVPWLGHGAHLQLMSYDRRTARGVGYLYIEAFERDTSEQRDVFACLRE
jgi:hypothetical protein